MKANEGAASICCFWRETDADADAGDGTRQMRRDGSCSNDECLCMIRRTGDSLPAGRNCARLHQSCLRLTARGILPVF